MANGVITWNGVASDTLGIVVSKVPSLNRPQRKYNSYSVPGRNGDLVVMQDAYAEYEQEYEIFALDGAQVDARAIVDWLYQDGWCKLADDWEPEYYRMAYFVGPLDIETLISEAAVCTITFRCRPQRFIVEEPIAVTSGDTITNPTNHIAKPIITLTGSGNANLIDLRNKSAVTAGTAGTTPYLSKVISAYENGNIYLVKPWLASQYSAGVTLAGTSLGGTVNTITPSTGEIRFTPNSNGYGVGLVAEVRPDTDYYFQCYANNTTKVIVWFGASSGYNQITSAMESATVTGFTFHTPVDCGYVLIGLFGTNGSTAQWMNTMLSAGTSRRTFQPYVDAIDNALTINNTTLQFSVTSFGEAVIDCERENFTIDGADANNASAVLDPYGNMSVDYLQLAQGTNTVTFSGDIASVTVDKRLWQL